MSSPTVTFWGAAQRVTGSMHLVETGASSILLDCGLALGPRPSARIHSHLFPFSPDELSAVVLSHAHLDHCGNLPHLVRQGFRGPIYCTPPTRDLLALMLGDRARHEEEDARVRRVLDRAEDPDEPLLTREDVRQVLLQCVAVPYGDAWEVVPGARGRLADAGHILGSAMVHLDFGGSAGSLTFTGDLGRPALEFLRPPAPVPPADLLISECTYGGRRHEPVEVMMEKLRAAVERSVGEGGRVLIPAFSLGRTQLVVHYLEEGIARGFFPRVPVFVDSPLAADIADVYQMYPECLLPRASVPEPAGVRAVYVRSLEESKELSEGRFPCIIVASGGMCEGGRIMRHLPHHIDDPRCSIVLVSYQAPYTLGRRLLERGPTVRFRGRSWNKWAEVVELSGFSGHADHDDFLAFLGLLAGRARKVRLVHGEVEQAEALAGDLRTRNFGDVAIPGPGDAVRLA